MPIPTFTGLGPDPQYEDIVNKVNTLVAELRNLMLTLDSLNVVSLTADHVDTGTLNANLVTIRSDLLGSSYLQLDGNGIRANNGVIDTFEIGSDGNAYFRGNITSDAIITGALIKTAATGARIELSSNSLQTYNASNNLNGLVWGDTVAASTYGDAYFYDNGTKVLEFYNNLLGEGYTIRPAGTASLYLGTSAKNTYGQGIWDFINGSVKFYGGTALNTITHANTSGATLAGLETEVNKIKDNLRAMNIYAT